MRLSTVFVFLLAILLTACAHSLPEDRATWDNERWGETIQQGLDNSCGFSSLLTVMRFHFGDMRFDEKALFAEYVRHAPNEDLIQTMKEGMSLLGLEKLAQSFGYRTKRRMFTFEELARLVTFIPVIVYLEIGDSRHFAVVRGISKDKEVVWLADSARGNVYHSRKEFLAEWKVPKEFGRNGSDSGGLMLILPQEKQKARQERLALKLLQTPSPAPSSLSEARRGKILDGKYR